MDTKGTAREGESIAYVRSNMTLRLSGHISIIWFGFLRAQVSSRQWNREKFAILSAKPRSHVRTLIYPTWVFALIKRVTVLKGWEHVKSGICEIK